MDYEEELESLQAEALAEIEGNDDDTNTDDSEFEESTGSSNDDEETEDGGEDSEGDEGENDTEDNEDIDDEDGEDDSEYDDNEADDTDTNTETNNDDFEAIEVEINGQIISLNSKDEMLAFIKNKGNVGNSTRHRKSQSEQIIEQGELSDSDLALLIDAKKGNKAAIAKLAKQSGVDIYDIDDDAAGTYKQEFQPTFASEVDEVAQDIMEDTQLHTQFQEVVKGIPQDFAQIIATDAKALKNFSRHVKSGLAQKVIPEAIKQQMLYGGSFIDNYSKIGREMSESEQAPEKSKTKRKENPRAKKLRERAKNHKGNNKGTKTKITGEDVWNMSTDDFNKKYM